MAENRKKKVTSPTQDSLASPATISRLEAFHRLQALRPSQQGSQGGTVSNENWASRTGSLSKRPQIHLQRARETLAADDPRVSSTLGVPSSVMSSNADSTINEARYRSAPTPTDMSASAPEASTSPLQGMVIDEVAPPKVHRRTASDPAPRTRQRSYPDDFVYLPMTEYMVMARVQALEKYFLHHLFLRSVRYERQYFEDPKWSDFELKVVLVYGLQIVDHALDHYLAALLEDNERAEDDPMPPWSDFVDPADLSLYNEMDPLELQYCDFDDLLVNHRTRAIIALVGKIKTRILESCAKKHQKRDFISEEQRRESLATWLACPQRLEYTLFRTPVKLLQAHFTKKDLNWAASTISTDRNAELSLTKQAWKELVKAEITTGEVRAQGGHTIDEIERLVKIPQGVVDFNALFPDEDELLNFEWDAEQFSIDVGKENPMPIIDTSDAHNVTRQQFKQYCQSRWRCSIAEHARHARLLAIESRRLHAITFTAKFRKAEMMEISPSDEMS